MRHIAIAVVLVSTIGSPALAQPKRDFGNPATDRFAMLMSRARVMKLAELCGLRPAEWVDQVDAMIHDKIPEVAARVSAAMKTDVEAGVGAAWGGLVMAMDLARQEHQNYGSRACEALSKSSDLQAIDLLIRYEPAPPKPAPKRRS